MRTVLGTARLRAKRKRGPVRTQRSSRRDLKKSQVRWIGLGLVVLLVTASITVVYGTGEFFTPHGLGRGLFAGLLFYGLGALVTTAVLLSQAASRTDTPNAYRDSSAEEPSRPRLRMRPGSPIRSPGPGPLGTPTHSVHIHAGDATPTMVSRGS
jgi:hypothetical protein